MHGRHFSCEWENHLLALQHLPILAALFSLSFSTIHVLPLFSSSSFSSLPFCSLPSCMESLPIMPYPSRLSGRRNSLPLQEKFFHHSSLSLQLVSLASHLARMEPLNILPYVSCRIPLVFFLFSSSLSLYPLSLVFIEKSLLCKRKKLSHRFLLLFSLSLFVVYSSLSLSRGVSLFSFPSSLSYTR